MQVVLSIGVAEYDLTAKQFGASANTVTLTGQVIVGGVKSTTDTRNGNAGLA